MKLRNLLCLMTFFCSIPMAFAAEPPISGQVLYDTHCAACHNGRVAKAPPLSMLATFSPRSVLRAMNDGVMQSQAKSLSPLQREALAEFMTGTPLTEAAEATAPYCQNNGIDISQPPKSVGWGGDLSNSRYFGPEMTSLSLPNMADLELAWAFAFPDSSRARSQPAVAGDTVFVGSQTGDVIALDRSTGCIRWTFTTVAEVRTGIVVSQWQASDSDARPLVFFGDLVGNVYAVDARTGALVWRDRPDPHPSLTITAAPALHDGRLYVALSSLEVVAAADPTYECCTFRGGVAAYDIATGEKLWVGYTIDAPAHLVGENSAGTAQFAPSGAPVWGTPVIDPKRGYLYVGTGESYSSPAGDTSDALLALSLEDGAIVWRRQVTQADAWNLGCEVEDRANCPSEDGPDYDFGAATILASDTGGRDVLLAGQKSGVVFGIAPDTGELLWQTKLGRGGIQGGVHFGMSIDREVLYVPMSDFYGGPRWPGEPFPGMFAVNVLTGEKLWFTENMNICDGREFCDPGLSAASSAIAGGVVAGAMDGSLRAYDRDTGEVTWAFNTLQKFDTVSGIKASGGSFSGASGPVFDGEMMFITSGYGIYNHMPGNVLLAFKLKEK